MTDIIEAFDHCPDFLDSYRFHFVLLLLSLIKLTHSFDRKKKILLKEKNSRKSIYLTS
jgi:hypothetical protein